MTNPEGPKIGLGYPSAQLAKAFAAARTHGDPRVRANAERRASRWQQVLQGMASGRLRIGERAPVPDLPAWVTPEVVRGGFATGGAAAGGDLTRHEMLLADELYLPHDRGAIFAGCLTERGLLHLRSLLASGCYRAELPEEAALLTVAWLVDHDDIDAALRVVDAIAPFADRLRFVPRPSDEPRRLDVVSRESVGQVGDALARRRPNEQVETMREALSVWTPFADELLVFWMAAIGAQESGRTAVVDELRLEGGRLRARYGELALAHRRCTKHRDPKENLAVLVAGLEPFGLDGVVPPRIPHVVASMVARRGEPGSSRHQALRDAQAANASIPAHHALAKVVVGRLTGLATDRGVEAIEELVGPVTVAEALEHDLPAGTAMPPWVERTLSRAIEGRVDDLLDRGLIPSAEVLGELVPQIAAMATAAAHPDRAAQWLSAETYLSFRNRRSLLLLDYASQVGIDELPWVRELDRHRADGDHTGANEVLRRLVELTLTAFPATLVPNTLLREMRALAREAGLDLPLVDELAADIFMGGFTVKYLQAAQLAGRFLGDGSLYDRYYGIDRRELASVRAPSTPAGPRAATSTEFGEICRRRAGAGDGPGWSVARNGTIIEQAQILTTHNLATLIGSIGLPADGTQWDPLPERCFEAVVGLVERLDRNPRPLRTVKDAAYAWRHMLFFLSWRQHTEATSAIAGMRGRLVDAPQHVGRRLEPALRGLEHVVAGGSLDGKVPDGMHRFLGWTTERHWILDPARLADS